MKGIRPFSCGSQYADWTSNNCDRCKEGYDDEQKWFNCDAQRALNTAYFLDGEIPEWAGRYMGYFENRECYIWACPNKKSGHK